MPLPPKDEERREQARRVDGTAMVHLYDRIEKLRALVPCSYFSRGRRCISNQPDRDEWCDYCVALAADDKAAKQEIKP